MSIRNLIPNKLLNIGRYPYHFTLSLLGALLYGFPSKKIKVVGVTGTKGKSTTVEMVNAVLEGAGYKTAVSGTIRFKIGEKNKRNMYKMTMPGRFFTQKFLSRAVKENCDYAVIEMTSEGAKQFRHLFINLDALIFLNLSPEHIESHGSYEKYRNAKLKIAKALERSSKKDKVLVVNKDDKESDKFLSFNIPKKITFSAEELKDLSLERGIEFTYKGGKFHSPLLGAFNASNILSAITFGESQGININGMVNSIASLTSIRGRVEKVEKEDWQNFDVVVDYAHTPDSLLKFYSAFKGKNKICILGNTGGGRDKWKRPEMGRIAEECCGEIILTNEDPYDENPMSIIEDMKKGMRGNKTKVILDRREAIQSAINEACNKNDSNTVILITGKGTDPYIMEEGGKRTPWDDAQVVREELKKINVTALKNNNA